MAHQPLLEQSKIEIPYHCGCRKNVSLHNATYKTGSMGEIMTIKTIQNLQMIFACSREWLIFWLPYTVSLLENWRSKYQIIKYIYLIYTPHQVSGKSLVDQKQGFKHLFQLKIWGYIIFRYIETNMWMYKVNHREHVLASEIAFYQQADITYRSWKHTLL